MTFIIQLVVVAAIGILIGEIIKWFAEKRLIDISHRARHEDQFIALAHELLKDERLPVGHRKRIAGYAKYIRSRRMEMVTALAISLTAMNIAPKGANPNHDLHSDLSEPWLKMFLSFVLAVSYRSFWQGRLMRTNLDTLFDQANLKRTEKIVDERGLKEYAAA